MIDTESIAPRKTRVLMAVALTIVLLQLFLHAALVIFTFASAVLSDSLYAAQYGYEVAEFFGPILRYLLFTPAVLLLAFPLAYTSRAGQYVTLGFSVLATCTEVLFTFALHPYFLTLSLGYVASSILLLMIITRPFKPLKRTPWPLNDVGKQGQ